MKKREEEDPFLIQQRKDRERANKRNIERESTFQDKMAQEREDEIDREESERQKEKDKLTIGKVLNPFSGLTDFIGKKVTSYLGSRPKNINNFMEQKGDMKMISFNICREPIQSVIKEVANIGTFGKLKKHQQKLNYDDVFHLFLVITFENGEKYSIEKNENVTILKNPETRSGECKTVHLRNQLTFNEVNIRAEKRYGDNYYRYDFVRFNCQNFLLNFTRQSGVNEFNNFIYQDFQSAISKPLRNVGGSVTDLASIFDRVFGKSVSFNN